MKTKFILNYDNSKLNIVGLSNKYDDFMSRIGSTGEEISSSNYLLPMNNLKDISVSDIKQNKEIDLTKIGKKLTNLSKVYTDKTHQIVPNYQIKIVEYDDQGNIAYKPYIKSNANIDTSNLIISDYVSIEEFFLSNTIKEILQITHTNHKQFNKLFNLAQHLHSNELVGLIKNELNKPIVFKDGGPSYNCAIYGEVNKTSYKLYLYILNKFQI